MWTSIKICSHCVAVVHCLDCIQDFIGWFTSHSKKLNLTKLCTSNVTQNADKKPSQNRYSQRKAKPPILSWTLHSSFISPSTTTINAPLLPLLTLYHQRMIGYTFWVCKLNKCITTCFGCRGKFTTAADESLPVASLDMILQCNESRPYYNRDEMLKEKENANTYYHPNNNYKLH